VVQVQVGVLVFGLPIRVRVANFERREALHEQGAAE